MTPIVDERCSAPRGGPGREGVLRSLLHRLRVFYRPDPDVRPSLRRPDEAYRTLEDARAVIARGWIQHRWLAHRSTPARRRQQGSGTSNGLSDVTAACLVGAVVYAVRQRGSDGDLVKAGPALDYLWDAWQESRGLGSTGVAVRAAPRELRMVRVRDLTRWNDQPGRTREEVLGLVDLATSHAIMAALPQLEPTSSAYSSPATCSAGRAGNAAAETRHYSTGREAEE